MGHAEAIVQIKWRAHRARTEVSPNLLRGGFANEKGDFEKRPDWLLLPWGACEVLFDSLPALKFTHSAGLSNLSFVSAIIARTPPTLPWASFAC